MQYGHFDDDAREYVITRPDTPRSWTNYLGSTEYGAIISNNAGGYSFFRSASEGRFTRLRFNNLPMDQPGRYFYLRDQETGDFWSTSWQPVGKPLEDYKTVCRHGTGYSLIESEYSDIKTEALYFVPLGQRFEYWKLKVTNTGSKPRKLSLFTYCEFTNHWNIDQDQFNLQYSQYIGKAQFQDGFVEMSVNDNLPHDWEKIEKDTTAQLSWMTLLGSPIAGFDLSREKFVGTYGSYANPEIVASGESTGSTTYGENSCGALHTHIELAPGESIDLLVLLGIGEAHEQGKAAVEEYGNVERLEKEFAKVKDYWHSRLGALTCQTPDKDFDSMVNVWNAYNSLITYTWSRSASFVYGGHRNGLGFRDTVQDIIAVLPSITEEAGQRLELMISGQFANGGALPVVKPFDHKPGQTPMIPDEEFRSDDCLWFFNTVPAYVAETGDMDFYNKVIPYADTGEATVFGHLRRALEFNLERSGANGLPCGLAADWNDCLKLGYNGESLFVAFQVRLGLGIYAEIAETLNKPEEASWALEEQKTLDAAIQKTCWSKDRFIWAIAEDGVIYGTHDATEGALYLNTQIWAVISGAATEEQARICMGSVKEQLATDYGIQLCAPPVTTMPVSIMAARLFNPGSKENAGIFNHTQGWVVMAECMLGNGNQAYDYHSSYLPAKFNDKAEIRGIEPYVHAQSTHARYSPMHGAARLPWLTGASAWAYYSSTAYILGIRAEVEGLRIDPCIPAEWPGFKATREFRGMHLNISVSNPQGIQKGVTSISVNDEEIEGAIIPVEKLSDDCDIQVVMGK